LKGELNLMKKVKILIAVLVCSVMMMGVGYAWWSDSITMATTAKTGTLNVEFEKYGNGLATNGTSKYVTGFAKVPYTKKWVGGNHHGHWEYTYDYDVVNCTLNNLYPGAQAVVELKVENTGSIPAQFDDLTITNTGDAGIYSWLEIKPCTDTDEGLVLDPDESATFKVLVTVREGMGNNYQNSTATFNIQFNWIQWNPGSAS
jgi:hypothetical protein